MSNPILTDEEQAKMHEQGQQTATPTTPADQAQQIANQNAQPGAVLPPQEAAAQQQEAIQAQALNAPAPQPQQPAKSQSQEIDSTVRGLLIQVIALLHNKDSQQQS